MKKNKVFSMFTAMLLTFALFAGLLPAAASAEVLAISDVYLEPGEAIEFYRFAFGGPPDHSPESFDLDLKEVPEGVTVSYKGGVSSGEMLLGGTLYISAAADVPPGTYNVRLVLQNWSSEWSFIEGNPISYHFTITIWPDNARYITVAVPTYEDCFYHDEISCAHYPYDVKTKNVASYDVQPVDITIIDQEITIQGSRGAAVLQDSNKLYIDHYLRWYEPQLTPGFHLARITYDGVTSNEFLLRVEPELPPRLTTDRDPPRGRVGVDYNICMDATGDPPIEWRVKALGVWLFSSPDDDPVLPAGLILDHATGCISGVPTKEGIYTFVLYAVNYNYGYGNGRIFTIVVDEALEMNEAPEITTTELPSVAAGTGYNQTLTANGTPTITWSLAPGSEWLPEGLSLSPGGVISGIPQEVGRKCFFVLATNDFGDDHQELCIDVTGVAPIITTKFTDGRFPDATVGTLYSGVMIEATGTKPIFWEAPGLPEGLSINDDGLITGAPQKAGENAFSVTASNGYEPSDTQYFTISVRPKPTPPNFPPTGIPPTITTEFENAQFPNATVGVLYDPGVMMKASGTPPISWTASGLPEGMSISNDGFITGTPQEPGKKSFSVTASNSYGPSNTKYFAINVIPGSAPDPDPDPGADAKVTGPLSAQTIFADLTPDADSLGQAGKAFILVVIPPFTDQSSVKITIDDTVWSYDGTALNLVLPQATLEQICANLPAYYSGPLQAIQDIPLISVATDLTLFAGSIIYIGYGKDDDMMTPGAACMDMATNGTYWLVYTVH